MLITKNVEIKVNIKNIKHLESLGYEKLKIKQIINIPVDQLMLGSRTLVLVKCDMCGTEKEISFKLYNYCISKHGIYTCNGKCSNIKRDRTSLCLFGQTHWMKVESNYEEYKSIINSKYGVDNIFKSKEVQGKFRKTIMERYGVSNLSHSSDVHQRQQISGFSMKKHNETGLYYRGTYELDFLNRCYEMDIRIEQGKRFKYSYDKEHYYFSDYYLNSKNLIIEIKSSYYWNKYLKKNLMKMQSVIDSGYNFLLILDKNYSDFDNLILKH